MITSKDEIHEFIPNATAKLVILGTMASGVARTKDQKKPAEAFFYHDNRNNFWEMLQLVVNPLAEAKQNMTITQKKDFLHKWHIAMANIVAQIEVTERDVDNSADSVLFKAHSLNRISFKTLSPEFKSILNSSALFFTCNYQAKIRGLIQGFLASNDLDMNIREKICFLPSPTRCNPQRRSAVWRSEITKHTLGIWP